MDGWVDLILYFLFFVKVEDNDYFKYSYVYMGWIFIYLFYYIKMINDKLLIVLNIYKMKYKLKSRVNMDLKKI